MPASRSTARACRSWLSRRPPLLPSSPPRRRTPRRRPPPERKTAYHKASKTLEGHEVRSCTTWLRGLRPPSVFGIKRLPAMSIPDQTAVESHIASFERELADAKSVRDAQTVRDRYLGRKNSGVASWMQSIGAAPADQKKNIGRYANELKQAIEARWQSYAER